MLNKVVIFVKQILGPAQKDAIRPIYYHLLGLARWVRKPAITPLPDKIHRVPQLRFRLDFFNAAQLFLQVNRIDGSYLEFGSHEVNTFRMALNTIGAHGLPNRITHFYAFDSFAGMPEPTGIDKQKIWRASMNFTSQDRFRSITRRDAYRTTSVKGFFKDSLPGFLLPAGHLPALVYIDCDYYESTKDVLEWLAPYLRHGTLLAFDDWDCYFGDYARGQRRAFAEFKEKLAERLIFLDFMKILSGGMAFICLEKNKVGTDFEGES